MIITTPNYLRMARRYLLRHKSFSLINILGLSTGIAACLLIYGYVHHQQSFDAWHPKADRIARVTSIFHSPESDLLFATTMIPMAGALIRDCPLVENAARLEPGGGVAVGKGTNLFKEQDFLYSEEAVFSLFYFSFLEGSPASALTAPYSIVLTRSTARKYFGDGQAMGKTLICNKHTYHVTAVIADRPANSDLKIDALLWKNFQAESLWMEGDFEVYTFVLFHGWPDLPALRRQMAVMASTYVQPELDKAGAPQYHVRFDAEMLSDVHFSKGKLVDTPKGNRLFNTIFSLLAVFILVVAILNYINLSTARAEQRAKEVAIRKVAGAGPRQLMGQFLGESFFLMTIAWLVGIMMAQVAIPFFNRVLSTHISFGGRDFLFLIALVLPLTALLAGAWPAFVLAGFQPIKVLKGLKVRSRGVGLRKVLTVVQFVIALAMLTGTVVIYDQMHYILHRDQGVDRSQMVTMPMPDDSIARRNIPAFSQALRGQTGIHGLTVGSGIPNEGVAMSSTTVFSGGRKRDLLCEYFFIDPQFIPLLHIRLAEGRNLSDSIHRDKKEGFLVNEAFVRTMGWQSGVGQSIQGFDRKGKVVGVVKDFFYKSLHNVIAPMVMIYTDSPLKAVLVKAPASVLPRLKDTWARYFPEEPFNYYFLDESFDAQYKDDRITMTLFNGFTLLAVFISCLGLYGLVSLITVRRTREIGIRKVLGASGRGLVLLLTREFFLLIGCAALIALPLAGWGLHHWLSSYAYHTALTVDMFGLPLLLLVVITLSVTGLRVIRAILRNPVESLRTE